MHKAYKKLVVYYCLQGHLRTDGLCIDLVKISHIGSHCPGAIPVRYLLLQPNAMNSEGFVFFICCLKLIFASLPGQI